jgi:hypothetical protein
VVQFRITGQTAWTTYGTVTWIGWQTISNLAPSTSYDVRVYATNASGSGLPSATYTESTTASSAGQGSLPGPIPWIGPGGVSTATTVSFSFSAPYTGGTAAAYIIQYRITGQSTWTTYGTVTWIGWQTIAGLTKSTSYDMQVYATNLAGNGPTSATYTVSTAAQ